MRLDGRLKRSLRRNSGHDDPDPESSLHVAVREVAGVKRSLPSDSMSARKDPANRPCCRAATFEEVGVLPRRGESIPLLLDKTESLLVNRQSCENTGLSRMPPEPAVLHASQCAHALSSSRPSDLLMIVTAHGIL